MAAESSNDGREDGSTHLVSVRVTLPEPERREERGHYLVVVAGLHPGRRFLVGAEPITIGRVAPCEIVIADTEISRAHCRVEGTGEDCWSPTWAPPTALTSTASALPASGRIANGGTLRIGRQLLRHDLRIRKEVVAAEQLENDLAAARSYVDSQLPARPHGRVCPHRLAVRAVGADRRRRARLPSHRSGPLCAVPPRRGGSWARCRLARAAVLNVLRKQALPGVDMRRSEDVLSGLNEMFPMEEHRDMFFTAWYGVYRRADRQIRYCCGGHHPGYLVGPGRETATPLWTRNPLLGAKRGHAYSAASATIVPGSRLYLFSDGLFEVQAATGQMQGLDDFVPLLLAGDPAI
jgi:hypothetical protein